MEALLGASSNSTTCQSTAHLQTRLHDIFSRKVTEARVEHVSVTFALPSTAIFTITVSEAENEALEAAADIDLQLGGFRAASVAVAGGQPAKQIKAIDALTQQPHDDPTLQRTVAKHLITAISDIDHARWAVRQVSRAAQGWTFTYQCKDSMQAWSRQNAKVSAKTLVGEWSNKDGQDPVNMGRPAFDCRGSVTISFMKSDRSISVKYEHTLLHKTVGQLLEALAPPPLPALPKISAPRKVIKTPNSKRKATDAVQDGQTEGSGRGAIELNGSARKRQKQAKAVGEETPRKKRKNKKAQNEDTTQVLEADMGAPEMDDPLPIGQPAARQLYNTQARDTIGDETGMGTSNHYPQGLVGTSGVSTKQNVEPPEAVGVHVDSIVETLPPGEAEHRRLAAIQLLSNGGVDPQTLSPDQFNIFANQSPDLQKESLAMLAKYGAERLRIVHPPKEASQSIEANDAETERSSVDIGQADDAGTVAKAALNKIVTNLTAHSGPEKRKRQTRGSCQMCRDKKRKCDRTKPSCSLCRASKNECFYPPVKPRKSKAADVEGVDEDDQEDTEDLQFEVNPEEPTMEQASGLVSPPVQQLSNDQEETSGIYQHPSGLTFPRVAATDTTHQAWQSSSNPSYNHNTVASNSVDLTTSQQSQDSTLLTYPEPPSPPHTSLHSAAQHSNPRHFTPSGQGSASSVAVDAIPVWQAANAETPSSVFQSSSPKPSRSRKPAAIQTYDGHQDSTVEQERHHNVTTHSAQASLYSQQTPYSAAAPTSRTKSRQGTRPQSRAPVPDKSGGRPPRSSLSHPTSTTTSGQNAYKQCANDGTDKSSTHTTSRYGNQESGTSVTLPYSSYNEYNAPSQNSSSSFALTNPRSENVSSSYSATTTPATTANHWGSRSASQSNNQPRASSSRLENQPNGLPSANTQSSSSLQPFSLHSSRLADQSRSATNNVYGQQQQPSCNSYTLHDQTTVWNQQTWYGYPSSNSVQSTGYAP